ncbi:hypothetical protein GGR28_001470 [Lewinella aquimaris]|uniref:Uncharacterized protein n=1 Tax=Neolewinella aquimaris TaxID=1835722 RepID=A0A840E4H3_9BACT|nr:carboxypeptidase-like regulatory domain-containing protein [Neolewinella aquimaris]MBB4078853.1 hypothetical protein [Neolewinella aquimaris]
MPAPLLAGLGAKGVSELIAIGGIVVSTGTTVATLPSSTVTIGSISLSMATAGTIYVGDRFIITGHVEVSYGEVSAGEGKIKLEIVEEGHGVLKTKEVSGQAPKERVTIRLVGQTISHGKKFYYLRATPTGEEDLSWWPTGDTVVTKAPSISNSLAIEVQKPLSFSTKLLSAFVNHGEKARAIMKVTNHSESRARLLARLSTTNYSLPSGKYLDPKTSDLIIIDHRGSHPGDDHANEQTFYFEPVKHYYHSHFIKHGNLPLSIYDQLLPSKEQVFDPIPVLCKGQQADRRVGYLPGHGFPGIREGEYAYACIVQDENESGIRAFATLSDAFGNALEATSSANGRLAFSGTLMGQIATLTITPEAERYAPYSRRLFLDQPSLTESDDAYVFHPKPLPPIVGVIMLPGERKVIPGTVVQLLDRDEEVVSETISGQDGGFTFDTTAASFPGGRALVRAHLPWNITYDWDEPVPLLKIPLQAVVAGDAVFPVKASVRPAEAMVTIKGITGLKDFASRAFVPAGGVTIVVRTETYKVVETATSADNGQFSFRVNAGTYLVELSNAGELGYREVPAKLMELRSTRTGVHVILRFPTPEVERITPHVIRWRGGYREGDMLAVLLQGEVVRAFEVEEGGTYIDLRELQAEGELRVAIKRGEHLGPGISVP